MPLRASFILIAGICLSGNALAQTMQVTTYFDPREQYVKETYYVDDSSRSKLDGAYTSYYLSGGKESEGRFHHNEPVGTWTYYYENGNPKMQGELRNGSNFGHWKYFFENGQLQKEGPLYEGMRQEEWTYYYESGGIKSNGKYLDDQKVGIWNYFYEDGALKAQAFYENGAGIYKEFYTSGRLKAEGLNRQGVSDSTWRFYYEDGTLKAEGNYEEGVKQGKWVHYYPNGEKSSEGTYNEGETTGKWVYYHENGNISAEGMEQGGLKEGFWKLYHQSGLPRGEGLFVKGEGEYREYYESGKIKVKGILRNDKSVGRWEYYYEDGSLEGEAYFTEGKGEYTGYYPDGSLYMKGSIKDNRKVGSWELYNESGQLAGYYKPIYENEKPIFRLVESARQPGDGDPGEYNKPDYRYRTRNFRYFSPRQGEFHGLILGVDPLGPLVGNLPVSAEYYMQERLGYQFLLHVIRDPFFKANSRIEDEKVYQRGFSISFRQKFYHADQNIGMLYFGHELRFSAVDHQANVPLATENTFTVLQAEEHAIEYALMAGNRLLRDAGDTGFTLDFYLGFGVGYRFFDRRYPNTPANAEIFSDVADSKVFLSPRLGITIGYILEAKKK